MFLLFNIFSYYHLIFVFMSTGKSIILAMNQIAFALSKEHMYIRFFFNFFLIQLKIILVMFDLFDTD